MREYNFLTEEFLKKHENIDNIEYLHKYIKSIIEYKSKDRTYVEKHHILPRCTFPQYENELWNIIEVDYETHKLLHLYLFKSINDRRYQRPLNWMMNYYKNSEEISNAAKRGWINLKNDKEKYKKWRNSRSESMKKLINSDKYKQRMIEYLNNPNYGKIKRKKCEPWGNRYSSENQSRRANIFWNNIKEEDYSKFCEKMKSYWTDEKKIKKSTQMIEYYSNPENVEKKRKESKDRWENLDEKYRKDFKDKMNMINKDENKRLDAGIKIKKKWKEVEYLEKMKKRKKKNGLKIKIIKNDGEIEIFENMEDIVRKYNFSTHLIRKYRDTNNRVLEKHLSDDNINLLGSMLETIRN